MIHFFSKKRFTKTLTPEEQAAIAVPERKINEYVEWRKQSVVFQFDRVFEQEISSFRNPSLLYSILSLNMFFYLDSNVEEAKLGEEIVHEAKTISLVVIDLIMACNDYALDPSSDVSPANCVKVNQKFFLFLFYLIHRNH